MEYGLDYFKFIHDELPDICSRLFGISKEREKNYVMGLSMGGYAALKCALNTPGRYAGCAAFSAAADIAARIAESGTARKLEYTAMFGPELRVPEDSDLFALAEKVCVPELPEFYIACGEQDELYSQSVDFTALLEKLGADAIFEHWAGIHNWEFWDAAVLRAFRHMFERCRNDEVR